MAYGKYHRRRNSGNHHKIISQMIVCIVVVLMIIGIKKIDYSGATKVLDVVESYISKDVQVSAAIETVVSGGKAMIQKPKEIASKLLGEKDQQAFMLPTDDGVDSVFRGASGTATYFTSDLELQVYAASNGTIADVINEEATGNTTVKIDHGNGIFTTYTGCTKVYVEKSQKVRKGDMIGSIHHNDTGENKLVFKIEKNGKPDDISKYIENI